MYVRLAFAVAAHLEPEILIVDEVLAVGDAEFQRKCLGKMDEVSRKDGRTVLFVSHNHAAIRSLCTHGLVLRNGIASPKCDVRVRAGRLCLRAASIIGLLLETSIKSRKITSTFRIYRRAPREPSADAYS